MELQKFSYSDFYSDKIAGLTLTEALEIHYKLNPQFTRWSDYEDKLFQKTMRAHDIAHIIFGCSTSLVGEMSVELWTLFANNLPKGEYAKLIKDSNINQEPFEILKKLGYLKVLLVVLTNLWRVPYIWFLSTKLNKKWPFFEEERFMNLAVGDIRKEYGIRP